MAFPWNQLPEEGGKAFAAFQVYRELGPWERSMNRVRVELGRPESYLRSLQSWSSKYRWVDRVRAWDQHLDGVKRRKVEKELEGMAERHVALATRVQQLIELKLSATLRKVNAELSRTGGSDFDVAGLSINQLAPLVRVATDLERLARGEATTRAEIRVAELPLLPQALPKEAFETVIGSMRKAGHLPGENLDDEDLDLPAG